MNKYISPSIEICKFKGADIITASGVFSDALENWAGDERNQPAVTAEVNYGDLTGFTFD